MEVRTARLFPKLRNGHVLEATAVEVKVVAEVLHKELDVAPIGKSEVQVFVLYLGFFRGLIRDKETLLDGISVLGITVEVEREDRIRLCKRVGWDRRNSDRETRKVRVIIGKGAEEDVIVTRLDYNALHEGRLAICSTSGAVAAGDFDIPGVGIVKEVQTLARVHSIVRVGQLYGC